MAEVYHCLLLRRDAASGISLAAISDKQDEIEPTFLIPFDTK
jgi:hypothetical protein